MNLTGRRLLVVGGSSGIGREVGTGAPSRNAGGAEPSESVTMLRRP